MSPTHQIVLEAWNAPSVLPRIALVLSRRRLTPGKLEFRVGADPDRCRIEISVACNAEAAHRLCAQLARLAELTRLDHRALAPALHAAPAAEASAA